MPGLKQLRKKSAVPARATTSLSLRWRVMLLAMSMVAMVVVLMAVAVYAVVSAALLSTFLERRKQKRKRKRKYHLILEAKRRENN
jgi:two-component system sensor histidine kinase MprB